MSMYRVKSARWRLFKAMFTPKTGGMLPLVRIEGCV
ncbi:hypothetical protein PLANTIT3_60161 [Plantibacter sp. T3]|nr:hypothetical protein PLANTIT3_60161 [Plantibacter sp. T3]